VTRLLLDCSLGYLVERHRAHILCRFAGVQRAAVRWVNAILIVGGCPTTSVGIRERPSPDFESREVLTSRAKYAVRATMVLAELKAANGWTSATELAEAADVPRKVLEAILTQLRDHGLLESRRGSAGGHRLAAQPFEVSAADVIRAIDGPLAMTPCASVTAFRACDDCVDLTKCRMRALMRRARDAVASVLEDCTLADLIAEGRVPALLERKPKRPVPS
jgi:Rrf2 family protein